jgi:hypothetical protein
MGNHQTSFGEGLKCQWGDNFDLQNGDSNLSSNTCRKKIFKTQNDLNNHICNVHIGGGSSSSRRRLQCTSCSFVGVDRKHLKHHIKTWKHH